MRRACALVANRNPAWDQRMLDDPTPAWLADVRLVRAATSLRRRRPRRRWPALSCRLPRRAAAASGRGRGRSRSSSSTSAAGCRITTASTSSPTPRRDPRQVQADRHQRPRPAASARCCRCMAQVMDKVALVRSGAHNNDHHETATNWVLSGRFGSAFGDYPAMGAVVAHETRLHAARCRPTSPSRATRRSPGSWARAPSSAAGTSRSRPATRTQPTTRCRTSPRRAADGQAAAPARRRCCRRWTAWPGRSRATTRSRPTTSSSAGPRPWSCPSEARSAFAIEQETDRLRDRYGRNTFGQSLPAGPPAGRGAASGSSRSTTAAGTTTPRSSTSLDKQAAGVRPGLLGPDRGPARPRPAGRHAGRRAWASSAGRRRSTRTPAATTGGRPASLLFAGAGVKPGLVLGATDKHGAYATQRPVAPADVAYTIYDSLGIDPHKQLLTPGRPADRDPRPGRDGEGAVLTPQTGESEPEA